eukprot:TRINITY_DN7779_c0_g1_i1.p1 TRINITY_DN7779_c0_g1~~TRINITY_DN7779_c0_g1_i1.p1  ORF type:complete len:447 (-),score=76.75 TRINITY_DN7779_c0_g1_i1:108-1448(-)
MRSSISVSLLSAVLIAALCCDVLTVDARPNDHKITNFPGYELPLNFEMYSGYVKVGTDRNLFYFFAESQSNPATDPLVLWLNGGPGCSSMYGFIYEHGPFVFKGLSEKNGSRFDLNSYSWNFAANMLYLESPAGVGYSYSDSGNYQSNDETTAAENYEFLLKWMELYPEFRGRPFYISGESYAGIYVPTLTAEVDAGNAAGKPFINLQGFIVGNGVMDREIDGNSFVPFTYGHGLISETTFKQLESVCGGNYVSPTPACAVLLVSMYNRLGDINIYDIYRDCTPTPRRGKYKWDSFDWRSGPMADVPCIDTSLAEQYFNERTTKDAFHAANVRWTMCSDVLRYQKTILSVLDYYRYLVPKYRALVYTGNTDAAVTYLGTERSVFALGLTETAAWRPWEVNRQVAGYVNEFGKLAFVTVNGVGHMVPEWERERGYELFRRFLENQPI